MNLLVKRNGIKLVRIEGRAFVDGDVPDFLRKVRFRFGDYENDFGVSLKDILFSERDWKTLLNYLDNRSFGNVYGLWSGRRSTLVHDSKTDRLFRLKGVALNPVEPLYIKYPNGLGRIEGGQEKYSAEFEDIMSSRFNRVLECKGIEPVMKVKGMWKYPVLAGRIRPVASIIEVRGDTRLDEFVYALGTVLSTNFDKNSKSDYSRASLTLKMHKFCETSTKLFNEIGYVVGGLKRLMDDSYQTWSSDNKNVNNAHWGNIVLYNGNDSLKVGLVDFDASCDSGDFSRSKIKDIQRREYSKLLDSFFKDPQNSEQITAYINHYSFSILQRWRVHLMDGFTKGYDSGKRSYSNDVDLSKLEEICSYLNESNGFLSFRGRSRRKAQLK